MTLVATSRALVVVLGRRPVADGAELVRETAREGRLLRLLSVGYPVTAEQRTVGEDALAEADRLRAPLDIRLVLDERALREGAGSDDVRVVASNSEARKINRSLAGDAVRTHPSG
jgi:hypothetical protein